jgi:hypothetical protein
MRAGEQCLTNLAATQKRVLAAVKSLPTFGLKIGYCPYNVGAALTVRKPKNTIAERVLAREDVARIIEREDDPRNHAILRFQFDAIGCAPFRAVCDMDLEGIVAKRKDGLHTPDATTWVKIKNSRYSHAEGRRELFERRRSAA